jgi:hypothetical protein
MTGCCERSNEPSGSIHAGNLLGEELASGEGRLFLELVKNRPCFVNPWSAELLFCFLSRARLIHSLRRHTIFLRVSFSGTLPFMSVTSEWRSFQFFILTFVCIPVVFHLRFVIAVIRSTEECTGAESHAHTHARTS